MTGGGAGLIRGDAVAIPLADESVDLVCMSPPYFALRSYTDGGEHYDGQIGSEATPQAFLEALWAVTAECWRVLKPSGSCWVNLGDKYAAGHGGSSTEGNGVTIRKRSTFDAAPKARPDLSNAPGSWGEREATGRQIVPGFRPKSLMGMPWRYALGCIDGAAAPDGQQWILRAEVVWAKPNGLPESVTDRVRRSHEQGFMFTKQPRYYSAVDEVREAYTSPPAKAQKSKAKASGQTRNPCIAPDHDIEHNPLGKLPGSVWTIASEPLRFPTFIDGKSWGTTSIYGPKRSGDRRRLWDRAVAAAERGDPCMVWECDHFAAYPQEWPRRIITGWSPPGICTVCGEGRRPTVEKELRELHRQRRNRSAFSDLHDDGFRSDGGMNGKGESVVGENVATITGYVCACPTADAPTRPAVILDPFGGTGTTAMVARALGRYGVNMDLSADYLRLARWRVFESGHAAKTRERANRQAQGTLL